MQGNTSEVIIYLGLEAGEKLRRFQNKPLEEGPEIMP